MQITCPACHKTSNSKADLTGKSVKCGCGKSFTVPAASSEPAPAGGKPASGGEMLEVHCSCGKRHRVPSSAAGRRLKCSCGVSTEVPGASKPRPVASSASTAGIVAGQAGNLAGALSPFHALTDDDWSSLAPPQPSATDAAQSPSAKPKKRTQSGSLLEQARKDLGENKKEVRSGASQELALSRWILIGIGALKLGLAIFYLVILESTIEQLTLAAPELDVEQVKFWIRVICGVNIGLACLFMVMGIFVFMLPMTCTISAFVLFVVLEIISLIANPFALVSIRGWIIRCVMGGALLQAINNAAYFKYVKSGARDPGKSR